VTNCYRFCRSVEDRQTDRQTNLDMTQTGALQQRRCFQLSTWTSKSINVKKCLSIVDDDGGQHLTWNILTFLGDNSVSTPQFASVCSDISVCRRHVQVAKSFLTRSTNFRYHFHSNEVEKKTTNNLTDVHHITWYAVNESKQEITLKYCSINTQNNQNDVTLRISTPLRSAL